EAIRLDSLQREEEAEQIHLDALLAQRIIEEEDFEATKDRLKRFSEELQTKTPKRLKEEKDDEAKDDESTKKSGKRRKQMARKGLNTNVDENDSEDSDKVGEHEESNTGTETPINPVPVAMKTPSVATYKIIKQGEKGVYQIVREDGTDIVYINFGAMLKSISRDDLTELYRIVMNRYGMDGPEDKPENGFWKCLRIMFEEPLSTDSIWSEIGQQKIISWRYYDTCRVHCLNLESMDVYMLSERKYPLSAENSPKFSGRITPLTPPIESLTAIIRHEKHIVAARLPRYCSKAEAQVLLKFHNTPNDYTPTMESKTSGGDDRTFGLYSFKQRGVKPLVKHHILWVKSQKLKKRGKKQKKKVSSVKLGRNKDEDAVLGILKIWDLERTSKYRLRQSVVTPRTLNFDDEAGPSSPIRPTQEEEPEEQFKDDEFLTLQQIRALETTNDEEVARKIQAEWDAEEERKRFEELKKAKPKTTLRKPTSLAQERNQMMNFLKGQGYKNLQKLKYPQMKELYDKVQESIKDSFKDFIPMDSEKEREMLKEREAKRLLRKRKATISEEQPSKKVKLRTETVDELRNYLRIIDFEKNAQDRESLEGISMITELQVIDSPDGEYLIIHRANNHFRAFDTLWEILHILDRQDLYHLYRVVQDYYEHIPPTGLGLILLGDLTTIWETAETSDDDFWKNQEDWEIVRWRLNESSGVHTLELEDGTMIHMLAERRYPLSRELMIRMLDHGMEVEDESEIAIAVIHLFILWTTEDGDDS
ncbi:hypothetical protein Tco_1130970, partial [Tanacetum coccineum]